MSRPGTGPAGTRSPGPGPAGLPLGGAAAPPHRVVVVAAADGPEQAAGVRDSLRALRHGPWWPPLDELLDSTRRFFAGGLAETATSLATAPR